MLALGSQAVASPPRPSAQGPASSRKVWQLLPDGVLYSPNIADPKEPRFSAVWLHETGIGWTWEGSMGGRFPIVRYGRPDPNNPEGWQIELEGAAFTRLDVGSGTPLDAVDFKAGVVASWRIGGTALKGGYSHLSSHAGDEFLVRNPGYQRRDYVRDALVAGVRRRVTGTVSVYGELEYAISTHGGAEPLELRVGAEYSVQAPSGWRGAPFVGVNALLRQEFDYRGDVNVLAGWQWSSFESGPLIRTGVQYYNGHALQYQFFDKNEELLGTGIWFDF